MNASGSSGSSNISNTIWMCGTGTGYTNKKRFSNPNSHNTNISSNSVNGGVWDVNHMHIQHSFLGHDSPVTSMCVDASENMLITASSSSNVAVWSLSKSPVHRSTQYNEHNDSVFAIKLLSGV